MQTPQPRNSTYILLADDDNDDRFFFQKALNAIPQPTTLHMVVDGEKLMDYLAENLHQLPDVIFLDVNMPRKNGIECLTEIKNDEQLKQIPVVMHSTSLRDETADLLYKTGAHYYLPKCEFTLLVERISNILDLLNNSPDQPERSKFVTSLQAN
ncbi:hypothetical protein BH09BAC1_BH09BAC1_09360 [soil metagenome]